MLRRYPAMTAFLLMLVFPAAQSIADSLRQNTGTTGDDSCLPFTMPAPDALFGSSKKVFAHYFYPFPLSVENKPASDDYYNRNYLSPKGENGKWAANGGFLRQRPLPVGVKSDHNCQLSNIKRELRL